MKRVWADEKRRKIERAKARRIVITASGKWIVLPKKDRQAKPIA